MRRLAVILFLGALAGMVLTAEVLQAKVPLQNQEKKRALREIYETYKKSFPELPEVTPEEAMRLLEAGEAVFIDVRPSKERCVSRLPEAISEEEFLRCQEKFRGKTAIAYDTVGLRSGLWAEKLRKQSIGVANLQEGLLGWLHAGGKIYDNTGKETRRVHIYGCIWNYAPKEYESVR